MLQAPYRSGRGEKKRKEKKRKAEDDVGRDYKIQKT
jgi:hypothetical protein